MLFDLGEKKTICEVRIMTQIFNWDPELPNGAQVKIGNSPSAIDGDFNGFKYFGVLPNPAQPFTTYVFKRERIMKGRYLSIQKFGQQTTWVLCHVMVL